MDEKICVFFNKLTKYSPLFYMIMVAILVGVETKFFNQEILTGNIIEILIILNLIPLTSFAITKARRRSTTNEVSLVCPDCNGKMKPTGKWECIKCGGIFEHGKKGSDAL